MSIFKEAFEYYRNLKQEEKLRKRLVKANLDYGMLQVMIDRAEDNPNLRIDITLKDGTKMSILSKARKAERLLSDYINGEDDTLTII